MLDPIYLILAAILGGGFVACLVLPVVWRLALIAARYRCERDELLLTVVKPLLAEVIAYRRGGAEGEEDEIEQEWV